MDENVRLHAAAATSPALKAALDAAKPAPKPWERAPGATMQGPKIITASELMGMDFPEPQWTLQGVLGPGLTVLAGKPKQGKSWLALEVALAVAQGQPIDGRSTWQGDVLYLALEDTLPRLKGRLQTLKAELPDWIIPETLHLAVSWPRMGYTAQEMGLVFVNDWLMTYKTTARLVIIDTLAKFRKPQKGNGNNYAEDYDAASGLKECVDMYGASAIYIHHVRKLRSEDPFDEISGTNGIAGAADTLIILENEKGRQKIYIKGRDIPEGTVGLEYKNGRWILGESKEGIDTEGRILGAESVKQTRVEACIDWIRAFLKEFAWPDKEALAEAKKAGFSYSAYRDAKWKMGSNGTSELRSVNYRIGNENDWWVGLGSPDCWKRRKPGVGNTGESGRSDEIPQ